MKLKSLASIVFLTSLLQARDVKVHQTGTLLQMESVQCGSDTASAKTFAGEILGTDAAHKKTRELLCQEYVLQTERMVYRIRPRDEKHPALLPAGEHAQFRIEKDRMKLRVEDLDSKERDYMVVSMTPRREEESKSIAAKK